ncbi:helix-turn-helix domain-containing protein [Phenylobacterium sp. LjRoot225]|uniref:helix-turn-helix domain-containing protein n=1 Tax=Phenylobacterium sp. LjRoot225 TaxID=3342285 RepID=UPI003ECE7C94
MTTVLDPNKAKTARRVIEVLEFFDEQNRHATVMDIARRYKRPQSSTSELLAILVEMGLLYKDPNSRSFTPTPRAAMLGSLCQPTLVRDGRLSMTMERLEAQTGQGVAVMGMVGLQVQMFRWLAGPRPIATSLPNGLSGGALGELCESAAGWLLLSTVPTERRDGVLRRLRAEAAAEHAFNPAAIREQIEACGRQGYAIGPAGFGSAARMCAILLPCEPGERPMAVGLIHEANDDADPQTLIAMLQRAVQGCIEAGDRVRHLPL